MDKLWISCYTSYMSNTINDFRQLTSDDKIKSNFLLGDTINSAYMIIEQAYETNNIKVQKKLDTQYDIITTLITKPQSESYSIKVNSNIKLTS